MREEQDERRGVESIEVSTDKLLDCELASTQELRLYQMFKLIESLKTSLLHLFQNKPAPS